MRRLTFIFLFLCAVNTAFASDGDTTVVQTFSFADGRGSKTGKFLFPSNSNSYSKILMLYTVKCDPSTGCGEWDWEHFTHIVVPKDTVEDSITYDTLLLQCYVTPYGNGLSSVLGNNGFTYVSDVSDFVHFMHDSLTVISTNDQELVDIKFMFIEGTPARNVINVRNVWHKLGRQVSLSQFDNIITDTTISLSPDEKMVKVRAMLTGHGFNNPDNNNCAEFCDNIHTLKANNQTVSSWNIIQPCYETPLSPQNGTWAFARAGWCPGMPATTREFELTQYINNNCINFDYDITADPYGSYNVVIQLVTYDSINQSTDVALTDILSPSTDPMNNRNNPTWKDAIIKMKNLGANDLTSVDIHYRYDNHQYTYQWTGNLIPMQEIVVELPHPNFDSIGGSNATGDFYVELLNPNGVTDPTPYNNHMNSSYKLPPLYNVYNYRVEYKSPVNPSRTYWRIYDSENNIVVKSDNGMQAGQTYNKEFTLADGCYMFEVTNLDGCGLYNGWYDGSGTYGVARFQRVSSSGTNVTCHNTPILFGEKDRFMFAVKSFSASSIDEPSADSVRILMYANPASEKLNLDLTQIDGGKISVIIYDNTGKQVAGQPLNARQINTIDISNLPSGSYFVEVLDADRKLWKHKLSVIN
ncbi:MAG: T9SS type A sorting domain-containing protein [Bacteroidales bacterium]|jgi:hypothetical protein|nr:T9SS type A sorting domain-containing protein [Bacteroidales bacterium]